MGSLLNSFGDVIVDDEELTKMVQTAQTHCDDINNTYNTYLNLLTKIKDSAIMSGETHLAISAFAEIGESLRGLFEDVGDCAKVTTEVYLHNLDDTDKYIY